VGANSKSMVEDETMVEEIYKKIPSKGTRLWMMVWLEAIVIAWALYATFNSADSVAMIAVFAAWADFTKWNVGIYAASETVVKGGEAAMNK